MLAVVLLLMILILLYSRLPRKPEVPGKGRLLAVMLCTPLAVGLGIGCIKGYPGSWEALAFVVGVIALYVLIRTVTVKRRAQASDCPQPDHASAA